VVGAFASSVKIRTVSGSPPAVDEHRHQRSHSANTNASSQATISARQCCDITNATEPSEKRRNRAPTVAAASSVDGRFFRTLAATVHADRGVAEGVAEDEDPEAAVDRSRRGAVPQRDQA